MMSFQNCQQSGNPRLVGFDTEYFTVIEAMHSVLRFRL
jgi:hypothetical protein